MAKGNPQEFRQFIDYLDEARSIDELVQNRDNKSNPSSVRDDAGSKLKDLGYANFINEREGDPNILKREDLDDLNRPTYENDNKLIEGEVALKRDSSDESASNLMANLNDFVDNSVEDGTLEKLLANERSAPLIVSSASEEDKEVLARYQAYQSAEEFAKRYEKNQRDIRSEEEAKQVSDAIIRGARKNQIESSKKKGHGTANLELAVNLAANGAAMGYSRRPTEYAVAGLKEKAEEEKKKYEEVKNKTGKDGIKALREAYKSLAKENFGLARNLIYGAHKDKIDRELARAGVR